MPASNSPAPRVPAVLQRSQLNFSSCAKMSLLGVRWETDALWCQTTEPLLSTINTLGLAYPPPALYTSYSLTTSAGWSLQHGEVQTQVFNRKARLRKIIHTYGQYFSVQVSKLAEVTLQLTELPAAEGSPEATIEYQDHVLVASIRFQADLRTVQGARQCKQGSDVLRRRRFGGRCCRGSGLRSGRWTQVPESELQ